MDEKQEKLERRLRREYKRESAIDSVIAWYHNQYCFANEIADSQARMSREVLQLALAKQRYVKSGGYVSEFKGLKLEVERLKSSCDNFLKHLAESKEEFDETERDFEEEYFGA